LVRAAAGTGEVPVGVVPLATPGGEHARRGVNLRLDPHVVLVGDE
jgi:hypothetical protein